MGEVAKIEQPRKAALTTGGAVAAMVPTTIESAWRLSEVIAASGMAPKSYGTDPNKIMVGILAGMEVGFTPFAALQSIAVINGNPQVWGDGALALVQASGLLDDIEETDDGSRATCTVKRAGKSPVVRTFDMDDAKRAGLAGKAGPWTQYPKRMRQMRARAFALRDCFPDVLKGLRIAEEVGDYQDITPAPTAPIDDGKPSGRALLEASLADPEPATDPEPIGEDQDDITTAAVEEATGNAPQNDAGEAAASASGGLDLGEPDYVHAARGIEAALKAAEYPSDLEAIRRMKAEWATVKRGDPSLFETLGRIAKQVEARLIGEGADA